jgi:hypothetical protein
MITLVESVARNHGGRHTGNIQASDREAGGNVNMGSVELFRFLNLVASFACGLRTGEG